MQKPFSFFFPSPHPKFVFRFFVKTLLFENHLDISEKEKEKKRNFSSLFSLFLDSLCIFQMQEIDPARSHHIERQLILHLDLSAASSSRLEILSLFLKGCRSRFSSPLENIFLLRIKQISGILSTLI